MTAMRHSIGARRAALVLIVLASCVGCDQTAKSLAQSHLSYAEVWSLLGDTVRLQLTHNHGAFLSFGAALPETWRHALFGLGVGALLVAMFLYSLLSRRLSVVGTVAIALYVAGGVSNLVDRIVYGGYVVDFINVGIGPLRTGIFNIADVFIMAGAVVLAVHEVRRHMVGSREALAADAER